MKSPDYTVHRQPLLWAALAFSCGIVAGAYLWRPPLWWLAAALGFSAAAMHFARRRVWSARALGLGALMAAGALMMQARPAPANSSAELLAFADGRELLVTAHVTREGNLQQEGFGEWRQVLDLESEEVSVGDQIHRVRGGLRLGLYARKPNTCRDVACYVSAGSSQAATPMYLFRYGERLRFAAKLYQPRNFRNPGAFDYRGYLQEAGIVALASAKAEQATLLPGFAGTRSELWLAEFRRGIVGKIQQLWPAEQAALVDAMLLGEESFLGRALRTDFQRTGTYHVLVVSGLKVGILALAASWLLRRLHLADGVVSAITIALVVAYALLTGVGTPVWRATLMLALYFGARLLYRQRSTLNTIGAAALALLMLDPTQLFGASFQLSFLSVLIIAGVALPLMERTTQPFSRALRHVESTGYDVHLPPAMAQLRLDLRMIAGRLERLVGWRMGLRIIAAGGRALFACCNFLLISALLQIGLTLPMAYYFHRATPVSMPANIVAVPLTEIIMVAAILAVGLAYIWLALAKIPAFIAAAAVQLTSGSVRWFGGLRLADARVATPEIALVVAAAVALVLAMIAVHRRPLFATMGIAGLAASAIWICAVPPRAELQPGVLEVTSIDVGQGDSILLALPQGQTMLVDAGGLPQWMHSELDIGEDVVSPYLWSRGISHLDTVVITHAHADHIGGMGAVLANFHPHELWIGVDDPSAELQSVLEEARQLGIPVIRHTAGDNFPLGGAAVRILAPARNPASKAARPNDDCLVMKVSLGKTSALLEGDAERGTERRIVDDEPNADLLKVAHHGSATSTLPELLAAVHPRFAVISVGTRNVYGHPRWEVLNRLAESGIATYRTDLDGAVSFYLDGSRVRAGVAGLR